MNQNQIQQLTSHLSQALDQNYDVVNMDAVLAVISALEGTTITKEQLEATRLAKYINQLRRRTQNEQLARRAKSLLKKWREMVGIQQTSNDSQQMQQLQQPQQLTQKPAIGIPTTTEQSTAETVANTLQYSQSSSPQPLEQNAGTEGVNTAMFKTILTAPHAWNTTHNANSQVTPNRNYLPDSHTEQPSCVVSVHNFHDSSPSFFNKSNSGESNKDRVVKSQRKNLSKHLAAHMYEHSSNSTSNFAVGSEKINETAIVIDIVSDSDDYESGNQEKAKTVSTPSSLALPPVAYPKPKKMKKEKKRKEKDGRTKSSFLLNPIVPPPPAQVKDTNIIPAKDPKLQSTIPAVSEILSLSNSSMSSLLSFETSTGNSLAKARNAADLTFAGRFKSASQGDTISNTTATITTVNHDNEALANGQKALFINAHETRSGYEGDFFTNDTSTSCSRLSPFEEVDSKQNRTQSKLFEDVDAASKEQQNDPIYEVIKTDDPSENALAQVPKKRGRKKGSKGVDSVIAKESLSQQILFGSGVKKVKTTKELFNEIQNRKLSDSSNRSESASSAVKDPSIATHRAQQSRTLLSRPTSSCSETSMHSPQMLDDNSANVTLTATDKFSNRVEDTVQTDSDTGTSEPSHDSPKSREIKRSTSLDSNSNSFPTSSAKTTGTSTPAIQDDVCSQLMHLVHNLKSPRTIFEAEESYQAEIVPCTCVILEELLDVPTDENNASHQVVEENEQNSQYCDVAVKVDKPEDKIKPESSTVEEPPPPVPQKPKKSIFDLDFDEDEDLLHSLMQDLMPSKSISTQPSVSEIEVKVSPPIVKSELNDDTNNVQVYPGFHQAESVDTIVPMPIPMPIYTIHEDPDCAAKRRFEIQTNEVTSFHINALHNCYIPNINGNWDIIDSAIAVTTTVTKFMETLDSYTVTDGADVVPKYGSLVYARIRKDLSFLKFPNTIRTKIPKMHITPFLGVAKCLPSCRKNKRLKDAKAKALGETTLLTIKNEETNSVISLTNSLQHKMEEIPLKVEVEDGIDDILNVDMEYLSESQVDGKSKNNNTHFSYNLLKLANRDEQQEDKASTQTAFDEIGDDSNEHTFAGSENQEKGSYSRRSSSCSNSSLKQTQHSINEKLRNQRTMITQQERSSMGKKRKKRRKQKLDDSGAPIEPRPRIKRIKIAINGNVATQRQISNISSSNNSSDDENGATYSESSDRGDNEDSKSKVNSPSEDELESTRSHSTTIDSIAADEEGLLENEYDNSDDEEYAIVQRPMGGGSNHIVLTIKKTPSKINSPANSVSAVSPAVAQSTALTPTAAKKDCSDSNDRTDASISLSQVDDCDDNGLDLHKKQTEEAIEFHQVKQEQEEPPEQPIIMSHTCLTNLDYLWRHFRRRRRRRRLKVKICPQTLDIELKHLFNDSVEIDKTVKPQAKLHHKLFFHDELCRPDSRGRNRRIINYSSSSSSCSNYDSDSEHDEYSSSEDTGEKPAEAAETENVFHKKNNKIETDTSSPSASKEAGATFEDCLNGDSYLPSINDVDDDDDDDADTDSNKEFGAPQDNGNDSEDVIKVEKQDELNYHRSELPMYNNGMLPSFNSIYTERQPNDTAGEVKQTLPLNKNCDDVNLYYNNNNLSVVKDSLISNDNIHKNVTSNISERTALNNIKSEQSLTEIDSEVILLPRPEYQTGMRAVAQSASSENNSNPNSTNIPRIQQFKEWHQVLQLQSYNNEPLIVLPYVVLE
ncbi:mediator of RNA polymerase II transcription subunit 26 [Scaptodrosophila lebanonensis]|uniref:Mediator of RNA polymerase II transcription subunit 26 n=1 Tax=Drosophila lebanonensis TaxID=7225 RepID=A0A6J2TWZ2_DROLE|nr:mediator of RNA polymerase II transcription subunit 26 [Scaptodrosophila lebanonensis]XP_030379408.1 mediator of RNA polymerase II transcription subunit 26 [Scaptodrosophila lebanonensis]